MVLYAEPGVQTDIELSHTQEQSTLVLEPLLLNPQILKRVKALAARRGVDHQSIVRAWAKGCLEVELRKMTV